MSPSLDWLAWLGLARLASAWLVSSAAATTTAITPEESGITTVAVLRGAIVVAVASSMARPGLAMAWWNGLVIE